MAELDQITAATHAYVRSDPKLIDMVFNTDPLMAYLRKNVRKGFPGGSRVEEPFIYDGLTGGAYAKGQEFDITEKQVEQNLQFDPKFFEVNATLALEDVHVFNRGPAQKFSIIRSRMQNAYMTIGAHMALALYLPGQGAGYTRNFNGLAEALNDNTTASWNGSTYATYGTITRGGAVGTAINSAPRALAGVISYTILEQDYMSASFGGGEFEPNLGVTTAVGVSYVKNQFQPQQRFTTNDPNIGFIGLQFNRAIIIGSRYCPGSYLRGSAGTADPIAVTYLTQTSGGAVTAYPALQGGDGTNTEVFFWINARNPYINLYVSDHPLYSFGFTGWKGSPGNTKVSGQVLCSAALTVAPRFHRQIHSITG